MNLQELKDQIRDKLLIKFPNIETQMGAEDFTALVRWCSKKPIKWFVEELDSRIVTGVMYKDKYPEVKAEFEVDLNGDV